jgi:hypothetical protein
VPWLIPVRFDDCDIPDLDLGGGRTLASIQRADLFGDSRDAGVARLVVTVLRVLGRLSEGGAGGRTTGSAADESSGTSDVSSSDASRESRVHGRSANSDSATENPLTMSGRNSRVLEIDLARGNYRMSWTTEGRGYFGFRPEPEGGEQGGHLVSAVAPDTDSGEVIVRISNSGRQIFTVDANGLAWTLTFTLL